MSEVVYQSPKRNNYLSIKIGKFQLEAIGVSPVVAATLLMSSTTLLILWLVLWWRGLL
jgi:hypothetical protein